MKKPDPFANKFASYLKKHISDKKNQELFNGQFAEQSQLPSPHSSKSPIVISEEIQVTPKSNSSSVFSFNSSEFEYSRYKSSEVKKSIEHTHRKRLRKMREMEQNECAICLDQIKNKCVLQCQHKFCYDCLQEWFASSNRCPYCRAESSFYWNKGEQFKVESKQFEYEPDHNEQMDWVCYNCDSTEQGDIVLICDRCEANACHIECDRALRGREPTGDWFCHFCR